MLQEVAVSTRFCAWTLFAALHLLIVICGACDSLPDGSTGPLAHILQSYAAMSGAESQYGFYAPDVGERHRPRFILKDDRGFTWQDSFEGTKSPEARLRLEGTADYAFANGAADKSPSIRQHLVKSWAAAMFTRHPSASSLTVVVEAFEIPTMAEFRAGSRRRWRMVYQAQLRRDSTMPSNLLPDRAHEGIEP
jgi:hypothetical protein